MLGRPFRRLTSMILVSRKLVRGRIYGERCHSANDDVIAVQVPDEVCKLGS